MRQQTTMRAEGKRKREGNCFLFSPASAPPILAPFTSQTTIILHTRMCDENRHMRQQMRRSFDG